MKEFKHADLQECTNVNMVERTLVGTLLDSSAERVQFFNFETLSGVESGLHDVNFVDNFTGGVSRMVVVVVRIH